MKIGIDVRCLMQKNYSGVSWYTYNLLQALFELDKDNNYILFYNSSKAVDMPKFSNSNVRYVNFKYPNKLFNLSLGLFNRPKIGQMLGGLDIFFMPNMNFCALSDKCRQVVTVHDLSYLLYPHFFTIKSNWWHKILLNKKIVQRSDAVIAVSSSTKNDLINHLRVKEDRIKIIYEGVDGKFKAVENPDELIRVRKKYKLPQKFILYLGTLEPRKNIESIISAYGKLKSEYGLVIGGGAGWKLQQIKNLAKQNPQIKIIGYVDEADKRGLYSLADLFVYPSYYEGFGLPPIEAMACGTPVIAGANSSQAEIVGEAGLLVDPYNITEISKAMELMLTDEVLRNKFIQRGFKKASEFDWHDTAVNTLKVFETCNDKDTRIQDTI